MTARILSLLMGVMLASLPNMATAQQQMPPAPYAYRQLDDPAKEAKARALMDELRCLVCQGQSIADSDAPLAGDMRSQVRERIARGEEPAAVRKWLIDRYGEWVTYKPPFAGMTAVLWLLPILLLTVGVVIARRLFVGGADEPEDRP